MTAPITWTVEDINAVSDVIRSYLDEADPDVSRLLFNSDVEELAMRVWPVIDQRVRERLAAYLERAGGRLRGTGLLGDQVSGNTLVEAAEWCRNETIWDYLDEEAR